MPDKCILEMRGIEIQFPGVKALDKVDFSLREGEVHALLGENGAGKSTLIKCLTGVHHKDAGTILLDGKEITPVNPQAAIDMGISTVYQEVNLCPNLTVAENIFVGRQPMKHHQINWKEINRRAKELMARFHLNIDVTRPLSYYSTAIQQMVAIARAVDIQAKILILDEPTSSLDDNEVQLLFDVVRDLKSAGMGIIFITHFLDQVYAISDRMTILRNGQLIGTGGVGKNTDGVHELGYNLRRDAWGRGYATEAAQAMLAWAYHSLGVRDFVLGHAILNRASGNVARKCGFQLVRYGRYSRFDGSETFDAAFYALHLKGDEAYVCR